MVQGITRFQGRFRPTHPNKSPSPLRPHDDGGGRNRHLQPLAGVPNNDPAKLKGRDPTKPASPHLYRRDVHGKGITDPGQCGTAADPSDSRKIGSSYEKDLHKLHAELVAGDADGYYEIRTTLPRALQGKPQNAILIQLCSLNPTLQGEVLKKVAVDVHGPQNVFSSYNAKGLSILRNLHSLKMAASGPQTNMPRVPKAEPQLLAIT